MKLTLIKEAVQVEEPKNLKEEEKVIEPTDVEPTEVVDTEEVITEPVNEPLPVEEPMVNEVPAEIPVEQPTENDVEKQIILNVLNDEINSSWQKRDRILTLADNAERLNDNVNKEAIKKVLNEIADDVTINIGIMYKVIQLINPDLSILLDKGQTKAEETLLKQE